MRTVAFVTCLAIAAGAAASPPPPREYRFSDVLHAAEVDLEACNQLGVKAGVYGDVQVKRERGAWVTSPSRSLGTLGKRVETCVRDAIDKHFALIKPTRMLDGAASHTQYIGRPVVVLPPVATLLPTWRSALTPGLAGGVAKGALRAMLPADYTLTPTLCMKTERAYAYSAEMMWLEQAGTYVPRMWHAALPGVIGAGNGEIALWTSTGELLVHGPLGLCLIPFGPARQPALRAELDKRGACWAGSFEDVLLHPRFEFPTDRTYKQVATLGGRACALTTTGEVTCCGSPEPALPPAPSGLTSIALGYKFACGLDAKQAIACWGDIETPPRGKFTKISADHGHACGLATDGTLACWGLDNLDAPKPPAGTFIDVAAASGSSCGVRSNGTMECWGRDVRVANPPGLFTAVTAGWGSTCGLRRDRMVACWHDKHDPLAWPSPDKVKVLGDGGLCGVRDDGTLACAGPVPWPLQMKVPAFPTGKFTQVAGTREMACGVRDDRRIECWGDVWPGESNRDNTFTPAKYTFGARPYIPPPAKIQGRITDERGTGIAGEVLACFGNSTPCNALWNTLSRSSGSLADRAIADKWPASSYVIVAAAADGTWTVAQPTRPDQFLFTAPDREIAIRSVDGAERVALRPASSIELVPLCNGRPCTGQLAVQISPYNWFLGARVERLVPGTYTIDAYENRGQKGERRGTVTVDVTYTPAALRVPVAVAPTGTGKSISGTLTLTGGDVTKHEIIVTCGPDETVRRTARPAADGKFVVEDVGAPPCQVRGSGGSRRTITVDKLPATGILVEDRAIQPPHRRP